MIKRMLAATLLLFGTNAWAEQAGDITGVWLTEEKDGYMYVYEENGKYFGSAIGNPANEQRYDTENPDDSLKGRSLKDAVLLQNLKFDGDDTWKGGTIYDPNSGKTYKCKVTMDGKNTLKLRGYIGSPMLGRTTEWSLLTKDRSKFDVKTGEVSP